MGTVDLQPDVALERASHGWRADRLTVPAVLLLALGAALAAAMMPDGDLAGWSWSIFVPGLIPAVMAVVSVVARRRLQPAFGDVLDGASDRHRQRARTDLAVNAVRGEDRDLVCALLHADGCAERFQGWAGLGVGANLVVGVALSQELWGLQLTIAAVALGSAATDFYHLWALTNTAERLLQAPSHDVPNERSLDTE